jgi:hypothetical protein
MSNLDAPSQLDSTRDLWHVRLPTGEVRTMSIDELDAAFQDGAVDEETPLCRVGATAWAKLRDLAGLEEPAPAPEPQNLAPQTPSPFAVDIPSVRPFATDVSGSPGADIDLPPEGFRPTIQRKTIVAIALAMGVVLGVALALTKADGGALEPAAAAAGVAVDSTLPPIVAAPKAQEAVSAPPSSPPASTAAADPGARLSNEQRKALLEVDKAHAQQHKVRSAPSHGSARTNSKPVFHKGGSKFDPLNSAI